jgi:hypothetical protein
MGALICNGQDFGVPAKILPAANQAPHKIEDLPRKLSKRRHHDSEPSKSRFFL